MLPAWASGMEEEFLRGPRALWRALEGVQLFLNDPLLSRPPHLSCLSGCLLQAVFHTGIHPEDRTSSFVPRSEQTTQKGAKEVLCSQRTQQWPEGTPLWQSADRSCTSQLSPARALGWVAPISLMMRLRLGVVKVLAQLLQYPAEQKQDSTYLHMAEPAQATPFWLRVCVHKTHRR